MKPKEITDWAAVCMMLAPMAMLAAPSAVAPSTPSAKISKLQMQKPSYGKSSTFNSEFTAWADKQDWFALSNTAEFGDFNREESVKIGRAFGYSIEFVDSNGTKHVLGIGLAKAPKMEAQADMKKDIAEMHAKSSIMMHGQKVSSDASGRKSRSFSGTLYAQTELSKTIMRPGTEEKWILCVCRGKKGAADVSPTSANRKENRTQAPGEENRN